MQRASFTFGFNPGGSVIVPVQAEPGHAPLTSANLRQFTYTLENELAPAGNPAPVVLAGKDDGREWRRVAVPDHYSFERGDDALAEARVKDGEWDVWLAAQEGRFALAQRTTIPASGDNTAANHFVGVRLPADLARELLGDGAQVFASPYAQLNANVELAQRLAIRIYCELAVQLPEFVRLRPVKGNSPMTSASQVDATRLVTPAIEVGVQSRVLNNVLAIFDSGKLAYADRLLVRGTLTRPWSHWPDFKVEYDAEDDVIEVGQGYDDVNGYPLSPTLRRLFAVAENAVELRTALNKETNDARRALEKSRGGPPV